MYSTWAGCSDSLHPVQILPEIPLKFDSKHFRRFRGPDLPFNGKKSIQGEYTGRTRRY